ncbi:MAG: molybdopterin-binding protein [Caulobacteraceae bacterium]
MDLPILPAPGGKLVEGPIVPVRVAVLVISDTRDEETDTTGPLLVSRILEAGFESVGRDFVPDDVEAIRAKILAWAGSGEVDAIVTTGGTGITGRDVTPEAVTPLFDKVLDGFSVIFHNGQLPDRGAVDAAEAARWAGIVKGVFVFCLPGSPGACRDGWDKVIRWQLDSRHKPCNMVELMPRLLET